MCTSAPGGERCDLRAQPLEGRQLVYGLVLAPAWYQALLWRRRHFVQAALKGCMSEQNVKRAYKVLSTSKQTACVGAGNQAMF